MNQLRQLSNYAANNCSHKLCKTKMLESNNGNITRIRNKHVERRCDGDEIIFTFLTARFIYQLGCERKQIIEPTEATVLYC